MARERKFGEIVPVLRRSLRYIAGLTRIGGDDPLGTMPAGVEAPSPTPTRCHRGTSPPSPAEGDGRSEFRFHQASTGERVFTAAFQRFDDDRFRLRASGHRWCSLLEVGPMKVLVVLWTLLVETRRRVRSCPGRRPKQRLQVRNRGRIACRLLLVMLFPRPSTHQRTPR